MRVLHLKQFPRSRPFGLRRLEDGPVHLDRPRQRVDHRGLVEERPRAEVRQVVLRVDAGDVVEARERELVDVVGAGARARLEPGVSDELPYVLAREDGGGWFGGRLLESQGPGPDVFRCAGAGFAVRCDGVHGEVFGVARPGGEGHDDDGCFDSGVGGGGDHGHAGAVPDAPRGDAGGVDCWREGAGVGDGVVEVGGLLQNVCFVPGCAFTGAVAAVIVD